MRFWNFSKLIFTTAVCLSMSSLYAQSVQQVQVVEYMERAEKRPMEGVSITAHNAPTAMTDAQGVATLQFRTLKNGDKVQARRIERMGYEVFNKDAVEQWNISSDNTFRIVMCESSRFRALCDQYQKRASENYAQQYQKEQEQLIAQFKKNELDKDTYERQLAELEEDYNNQLDNLENYIDRFARIDLETLSEDQQRIIGMIQEGRFDEAITILESLDYAAQFTRANDEKQRVAAATAQLSQVLKQKEEETERLREAIETQIKTYELVGGRENHQKSYMLRKTLVDADTTDLENVFDFVCYLHKHLRIEEAITYSNILLRGAKENPMYMYLGYMALGVIYDDQRSVVKAQEYYDKAIEAARKTNPKEHGSIKNLGYYVTILIRQIQSYANLGESQKAELLITEAEPIVEHLITLEPEHGDFIDNDFYIKIFKAVCIADQGRPTEAIALIDSFLEELHTLAQQKPKFEDIYELALNKGSGICHTANIQERAIDFARMELEAIKPKYEKDPEGECIDYFISIAQYANVLLPANRLDETERYLKESQKVLQDCETHIHKPIYFFRFLLNENFAELYHEKGDIKRCKEHARLSIEAFDKLEDVEKDDPGNSETYNLAKSFLKE